MATIPPLAIAGDQFTPDDLSDAAYLLVKQAANVTLLLLKAKGQEERDQLLQRHQQLVADAIFLATKIITLVTGEAKLTGAEIVAAIKRVDQTLKKISEIKDALVVVDALLKFTAAVLSGSGTAIVTTGVALSNTLKEKKQKND